MALPPLGPNVSSMVQALWRGKMNNVRSRMNLLNKGRLNAAEQEAARESSADEDGSDDNDNDNDEDGLDEDPNRTYHCSTCDKTFPRRSQYTIHLWRIHKGGKKFQCPECNLRFTHKRNLSTHMKGHRAERERERAKQRPLSLPRSKFIPKKPPCFVSTGTLLRAKPLTPDKPYLCTVCNLGFSTSTNLSRHIHVHTGEKVKRNFPCPMCKKSFALSGTLTRHMRVHTGEKPYECPVCNHKFSTSGNLSVHKKIHTGDKPFTCPTCNKGFSRAAYLLVHSRSHSGEKPFGCSMCSRRFTQSSHLTAHMRTHTGEKPFKCNECSKQFSEKRSLKSHMTTHTGEKLPPRHKKPTAQQQHQQQPLPPPPAEYSNPASNPGALPTAASLPSHFVRLCEYTDNRVMSPDPQIACTNGTTDRYRTAVTDSVPMAVRRLPESACYQGLPPPQNLPWNFVYPQGI